MKRKVIIPLVVFLAILGIGAAITYRPHTVPWEECSEVYRRYATTDGIRASYIKDYRVNDTITLNVTLLEATTDSAWNNLCKAFHSTPTESDNKTIEKGRDILVLCIGFAFEETSMADNDIAVSSLRDRYICIFHDLDDTFKEHILDAIIDKMSFSLKQQQNFYKNEKTN